MGHTHTIHESRRGNCWKRRGFSERRGNKRNTLRVAMFSSDSLPSSLLSKHSHMMSYLLLRADCSLASFLSFYRLSLEDTLTSKSSGTLNMMQEPLENWTVTLSPCWPWPMECTHKDHKPSKTHCLYIILTAQRCGKKLDWGDSETISFLPINPEIR